MIKRIIIAAGVLIAVGLAAGCGQKKEHDRGVVADGLYRNDFFGCTMQIPDGMYVMPRAEIENAMRLVGGGDDDLSETLLFISASDPAAADPEGAFNYNIAVTSEKVPAGITNNAQYAAEALRRLANSTLIMDEVILHYTTLGGREFVKLGLLHKGIRQDIYARWHDGYVLVVTASYGDKAGQDAIDAILSTITFETDAGQL